MTDIEDVFDDRWKAAEELLESLMEESEDPRVQYELEGALQHYRAADDERFIHKGGGGGGYGDE